MYASDFIQVLTPLPRKKSDAYKGKVGFVYWHLKEGLL